MKFSTIEVNEQVIYQDLEGEVVLLNLQTEKYFGLNEVGVAFWKLALDHSEVSEIISHLHRSYDVELEKLTLDICNLIGALADEGLLKAQAA